MYRSILYDQLLPESPDIKLVREAKEVFRKRVPVGGMRDMDCEIHVVNAPGKCLEFSVCLIDTKLTL